MKEAREVLYGVELEIDAERCLELIPPSTRKCHYTRDVVVFGTPCELLEKKPRRWAITSETPCECVDLRQTVPNQESQHGKTVRQ